MKNNQALTMYPLFFDPIYKKAEMKKIDGKDCICYQEDFWGTKVEEDGSVTFTMEAPKAETVEVSGFGGTLGTEKIAEYFKIPACFLEAIPVKKDLEDDIFHNNGEKENEESTT